MSNPSPLVKAQWSLLLLKLFVVHGRVPCFGFGVFQLTWPSHSPWGFQLCWASKAAVLGSSFLIVCLSISIVCLRPSIFKIKNELGQQP